MSTNEPTVADKQTETRKCVASTNFFGYGLGEVYKHREEDHEARRHLSCAASEAGQRGCSGHDPVYLPEAEPSAPEPTPFRRCGCADSVTALKMLVAARGSTASEVIRRAIYLEKYLHDIIHVGGGKVFVRRDGEPDVELVIR